MDSSRRNRANLEMQDLMTDKVLSRACLKSLEILGEASRSISEDLKMAHPEIPWRQMTCLRNKLVHHYLAILGKLWTMYSRMSFLIFDRIMRLLSGQ